MNNVTAHVGGIFRHKKTGGEYVVMMFATIEATMTQAVVYKSTATDQAWVRPVSEFEDGRFELVRQQGAAA